MEDMTKDRSRGSAQSLAGTSVTIKFHVKFAGKSPGAAEALGFSQDFRGFAVSMGCGIAQGGKIQEMVH